MALEIVRRVRGNLHGSIDVSALEDRVIVHPIFQRLRRIKQTAFLSLVFPGASHTRFEHSLGTMHLAHRAWTKIAENQKRLRQNCTKISGFEGLEKQSQGQDIQGLLQPTFTALDEIFASDEILQTLRLAALLHDIGHPPFSHSGERFLPRLEKLYAEQKQLPAYLNEYFKRLLEQAQNRPEKLDKGVSHEVYTILLVDKLFAELSESHPSGALLVSAQDVNSIISTDIPPEPKSELRIFNAQQVCHELISGELDIDRMDYLQRDSRECGVVYGIFDAERILDSLSLYAEPGANRLHLAIQFSGLAAFEDYLRARQSMYVQLYFHKTSVACEAMFQSLNTLLGDWHLPADLDAYILSDEWNLRDKLLEAALQVQLTETDEQRFRATLDQLLLNRRLWKRVYEMSYPLNHDRTAKEITEVCSHLDRAKIAYERIASTSYLTKIRPRKRKEASQNYLRLIKKDGRRFPRVVPIEDFSNVTKWSKATNIERIYVDSTEATRASEVIAKSFEEKAPP